MTDISSLAPHADTQLTSAAPLTPVPSAQLNGVAPHAEESIEDDESSIIKCICGYEDDDGNTVFCERCNTWQHIYCYYALDDVPDVHECADCAPRSLDREAAAEHQRRLREAPNGVSKKAKRPTNRPKKKGQSVEVNGWPMDKDAFYERKSGSPKDPPPSKKTKTTHKHSASVASIKPPTNVTSRKRAASTVKTVRSPTVKSPETPNGHGFASDYFSPEYMKLCKKDDDYTKISHNLFNQIHLFNDLSKWVKDSEACKEVAKGKESKEIFQRLDRPIEVLESTAPEIETIYEEDKTITVHGSHPSWHILTVNQLVPANAFIGELKGHIGRKEDYFSDSSSRWSELRHPEPFVFFHSNLPIFIDARNEGNHLRFIRRSCRPNLRMTVFVTDETQCHFCFLATKEIAAGEEITIPWDLDERILHLLSTVRNENKAAHDEIAQWVAGVLGNFGGCACGMAQCLLAHFDRRNGYHQPDPSFVSQPPKSAKTARKSKKGGNQRSPPGTGNALNSRAGSESVSRGDHDDDNDDSRSVSGSTRSKPGSRDLTPMTHQSVDLGIGLGVDLSDREKRKLQQAERLFQKYEEEPQANKRRKRNSAGSTLNTPTIGSSKQLGQNPAKSNRPVKLVHAQKPAYVDATMQTDPVESPQPISLPVRRAPRSSRVQRLLAKRIKPPLPNIPENTLMKEDKMDVDEATVVPQPASTSSEMPPPPGIPEKRPSSSGEDVDMKDVVEEQAHSDDASSDPPAAKSPTPPDSSMQPPVAPLSESPKNLSPNRPTHLHVQLPPTPAFPNSSQGADFTPTEVNTPGSSIAQSPSVTTPSVAGMPLMSPSTTGGVAPSPMKKKLSLSQYTSRKAKAKRNEALAAAADKEKITGTNVESEEAVKSLANPTPTSNPQEIGKEEASINTSTDPSKEGDIKAETDIVKAESPTNDS